MATSPSRRAAALALPVLASAAVLASAPAIAAAALPARVPHSQTFAYTGSAQDFVVPQGVTSLTLTVDGASGGGGESTSVNTPGGTGGHGGRIVETVTVHGGQHLRIEPGGVGQAAAAPLGAGSGGRASGGASNGGSGGFGDGNDTTTGGSGGGGGAATEVDLLGNPAVGTDDQVLAVAGGGGGGGGTGAIVLYYGGPAGDGGRPAGGGVGGTGPGAGGGGLGGVSAHPYGDNGGSSPTFSQGGGGGGGGGGYDQATGAGAGAGGAAGGIGAGGGGGGGGGRSFANTVNAVYSTAPSTGNGSVTVGWATPGVGQTLTLTPHPVLAGTSQTVTDVVTSSEPNGPAPTGTVTIKGAGLTSTATLTATSANTSRAVVSLPFKASVVSYGFALSAAYSGDAVYPGDTAPSITDDVTGVTALTVVGDPLPEAATGKPYMQKLAAVAGAGTLKWGLAAGTLPNGLSLSAGGTITGTPTTSGTSSFKVKVTDSASPSPKRATAQFSLTVNPQVQSAVYVVNGGNSAVHAFALGASGNAAPLTTLSGAATGLNGTTAVAIGTDGRVYVASANNNSIREYPYGAAGNATPDAVIAGPTTGLASPQALALDPQGRLYVANAASNSITVYAPEATGDAKPVAVISGAHTGLGSPSALTVDGSGRLWVANLATSSLTVYPAAADGDVAPVATVQGGATGLNGPEALATDAAGNLLVANTYGESIAEFASTATGNAAPLRTIAGAATGLSFPDGIDVDAAGHIYVSNQFAGVSEFSPAANGNVAPLATVSGPATGLSAPGRLAVAPPLSVRTRALPRARVGRRYGARLRANLGTTPYRWAVVRGRVPAGLHLRHGRLSGRPLHHGTYRFTVRVTDASHPHMRATRRLTVSVRP
jgi:sugar lactone lactonase YvrE